MLLVRYLAKLLERSAASDPTGKPLVIINNVAPGFCKTNLFSEMDLNVGMKAGMAIIGRSSEHGARTLVHGAVARKGNPRTVFERMPSQEGQSFREKF